MKETGVPVWQQWQIDEEIAAIFGYQDDTDIDGGNLNDITNYSVGAVYTIAPGLTAALDLLYFDADGDAGVEDRDGYVVLSELQVSF